MKKLMYPVKFSAARSVSPAIIPNCICNEISLLLEQRREADIKDVDQIDAFIEVFRLGGVYIDYLKERIDCNNALNEEKINL